MEERCNHLKFVNVTQWVRGRKPSSPTRPKASHQVGSRTEGRPLRGGVRSRGEARTQAASLNSEKCIMVDDRISPGNRTQSRPCPVTGRRKSCRRQGESAGHHRGLRAGHGFNGVTRELGRASRLLGNHRRSRGDRLNQHPGVSGPMRTADEPTPAQVGRDTKHSASTQGTGRERIANRPGWTKAVVATHSTAGRCAARHIVRTRGEPRPKGPTIKPRGCGKAMPGMTSAPRQDRRDFEPGNCLIEIGVDCEQVRAQGFARGWAATVMSPCGVVTCKAFGPRGPLLTNRMSELLTYGSVGGVGRKPGPYPAPNAGGPRQFPIRTPLTARVGQFRRSACHQSAAHV